MDTGLQGFVHMSNLWQAPRTGRLLLMRFRGGGV